jgi:transcriptional regulator with XRE-family HTH domain
MLTAGEILKRERVKKNLSLTEISKQTKIKEKYLLALEDNNWNLFESPVYIEGLIKTYARFLGLNYKKVLPFFYRDYEGEEKITFRRRVSEKYFTPTIKKFFTMLSFFIFFVFFIYFGYQLKIFLTPPKVVILSPKTDVFYNENLIKIIGKTEKETTITIFGEKIYPNEEGIFEYTFPLKKGKNELVIELEGANGRKTIFKKIFYKNSSS